MTTVQQIITVMEQLAPRSYAESWDNVGLMVGDRNAVVTGVVTTLDVTEEAVEYAIEQNCNLIVSHHLRAKGSGKEGATLRRPVEVLRRRLFPAVAGNVGQIGHGKTTSVLKCF